MKIKILRKCQGLKGVLRPGFIVEMEPHHARQYINQGFAQKVKEDPEAEKRQKKVVEPEKVKEIEPEQIDEIDPEDEIMNTFSGLDENEPKSKKRGRPKKKKS